MQYTASGIELNEYSSIMKVMFDFLGSTIAIGPLNLPLVLIPLVVTVLLYQPVIHRLYRVTQAGQEDLKKADQVLFNLVFIIIISWKLSPALFQFRTVIRNPMSILYLPGGLSGVLTGLGIAALYLLIKLWKEKEGKRSLIRKIGINTAVLAVIAVLCLSVTAVVFKPGAGPVTSQGAVKGEKAPDFRLEAEDGNFYSLSDYEGEVVIINFWASWCPPCRAEIPELIEFYESEESENTVFLSVNMFTSENDPVALRKFIEEQNISYPVLYDVTGNTSLLFGVDVLPTTIIIDRQGLISDVKSGAVTGKMLARMTDDAGDP